VKAISLHRDVLVVTSQLLQVNCTIVRGLFAEAAGAGNPEAAHAEVSNGEASNGEMANGEAANAELGGGGGRGTAEAVVIDSPILPEELELLPSLLEQAAFPAPRGLLATHADWDHLLGPLAFPEATLGCAESTAARLRAEPGAAQRALRDFDEELYLDRRRPLSLGSVQPLAVPGRCGIGDAELELHIADGHTADGMAVWIPWAHVLVAGDYLSTVELPALNAGERIDAYLATLERLRPLVMTAQHVVPGHGPVLDGPRALEILTEDITYLTALREHGAGVELPAGRRTKAQRDLHAENAATLR
jgi:glyoxylase-like metal-dependent hydrolase (beta-lactamase superfamily II)